jgi:hypothetical protein
MFGLLVLGLTVQYVEINVAHQSEARVTERQQKFVSTFWRQRFLSGYEIFQNYTPLIITFPARCASRLGSL